MVETKRTTSLCLTIFVSTTVLAAQDRVPKVNVGVNVLVSKDHSDLFHAETWFAADPNNAKRLTAVSMAYDVAKDVSYSTAYVSLDGGKRWQATLKTTGESVDPACAYGPDGTAYFVHLDRTPGGGTEIYRSKNGGRTWSKPVIETYRDRPHIAIDDTQGSRGGRIYLEAHEAPQNEPRGRVIVVTYSTDGGEHFSDAAIEPGQVGFANPGNSVVMSDGTLAVVFADMAGLRPAPDAKSGEKPHGHLALVNSTDGGKSLSPPVKIDDFYYNLSAQNLSYLPVLAVDRSRGAFRDRLYVAWTDTRSGRAEIYLAWSSDGGRTWAPAKTVNDDAPRANGSGPDDVHASVAVNKDGVVGVSWYDRRDSDDNKGWRARFAASLDGGVTFGRSVVVSQRAYDPARNEPTSVNEIIERTAPKTGVKYKYMRWHFVYNGGDTSNIVADAAGNFHVFWTDNRTGRSQIWTSLITVTAAGVDRANRGTRASAWRRFDFGGSTRTSVSMRGGSGRQPVVIRDNDCHHSTLSRTSAQSRPARELASGTHRSISRGSRHWHRPRLAFREAGLPRSIVLSS